MKPETVTALSQAAYNLADEAARAERKAISLLEEAKLYQARAAGLREAARLINHAVDEGVGQARN